MPFGKLLLQPTGTRVGARSVQSEETYCHELEANYRHFVSARATAPTEIIHRTHRNIDVRAST